MSTTPPPNSPEGQPLPPGLDPDAFTPFGAGAQGYVPGAPESPAAGVSPAPHTPPPAGVGASPLPGQEVTDPNLGDPPPVPSGMAAANPADEPTAVDTADSPYQTDYQPDQADYQPGEPYPTEAAPEALGASGAPNSSGEVHGVGSQAHWQGSGSADHGPADHGGGFEPPYEASYQDYDDYPQPSNRTNPILVLISGVLAAIILAGGGYIWFIQNQAVKTSQQKAIEAAQSEAKIAREEAQKAQEEAKKIQSEAAKQAEEAAKKASEEAAKAAAASPSAASSAPPAPATPAAPAKPAQTKPAPAPGKNRGKPSGSGCTPGGGTLPSGTWYAYAWEEAGSTIAFDLVCYYADGSVTNDSTKVRKLPSNAGWDPAGGLVGMEVAGGVITSMWEM